MSPLTIKVEPLRPSDQRLAGEGAGSTRGRVRLVAQQELGQEDAPGLFGPIVGFRNWRILGAAGGEVELSSPYFPATWREPAFRAECRRFRSAEDLLHVPHAAPDPACGCGICAYHSPTDEFSKIDFRGVSGIVTAWGRIVIDAEGMRAEHARVEALGVHSRWSRRQRVAVAQVAQELGVEVVDLRELGGAAGDYGETLPGSLVADERQQGVRARLAALLTARVGE